MYAIKGDYEKSIKTLKNGLEHHPRFGSFYHNIGNIYHLNLGDLEQGREWYEKAIQLEPKNWLYFFHLGMLLNDQGKIEDAVVHLSESIQLKETFQARYQIANLLFSLGKYNDAIFSYRKSLQLNPAHVESSFALANALFVVSSAPPNNFLTYPFFFYKIFPHFLTKN